MKKVQVLMSTYNGKKYLAEQIDSILKQRNVDVSILIRDDGSTDGTRELLAEFMNNHTDRIKIALGENVGVKKSFLKLICMADTTVDYYALSDQDDIWFDSKLNNAVDALEKEKEDIPLIYESSYVLYGKEYQKNVEIKKELKLEHFLVKNYIPGCTYVFNDKVKNLIEIADNDLLQCFPLHDHWMNLVTCSCGGRIIIDEKAGILYRQHDTNVVGAKRSILRKLKENGVLSNECRRYSIAMELLSIYEDFLSEDAKKILAIVKNYRAISNKFKLYKSLNNYLDNVDRILLAINVFNNKF